MINDISLRSNHQTVDRVGARAAAADPNPTILVTIGVVVVDL
jgi:hypothetical protein